MNDEKKEQVIENSIYTVQQVHYDPFLQFPKCFLYDENVRAELKGAPNAPTVYALCREMFSLSCQNVDKYSEKDGKIFFILPYAKIAETLGISVRSVENTMSALRNVGAIVSKRDGFNNVRKLYLTDPKVIPMVCAPETPEMVAPEPPEMVAPNKYTDTSNQSDIHLSNDSCIITAPGKPAVRCSPRTKGLFSQPAKTKTERAWRKWLTERLTQLNGRGYSYEVERALNSFLISLMQTNKSANQLSATSFELQLDKLDEMSGHPEFQTEAIYNAIQVNSKTIVWALDNICKREGWGTKQGSWNQNLEPHVKNKEEVFDENAEGVQWF